MSEIMINTMEIIHQHEIIMLVVLMVCADTVLGFFRAIKQHKFNSSFGIDGAIRKITMLLSLVFLVLLDTAVHINLVAFMPVEILSVMGLEMVGTTEFFGVLYISYEAVSVLKNMAICGLPVKSVEDALRDFLGKYTDELPAE
jgi:toxin secretion/phage lysis holin